jgi:hypothetical protein
MARENSDPFRKVIDSADHRALFDICYQGELESCPPDTFEDLLDFGWRRFLYLSGSEELGLRPVPISPSDWPDFLVRWAWHNRWMLAWDYSNDLINCLNVIEALLREWDSRRGQPAPTEYTPMPFLYRAALERQRGQYEAYSVRPDWVPRLCIQAYDVARKRSELDKRLGEQPSPAQVVEAILDERITQARSSHVLSALHHEKALFLHWSKKDCLAELQEAARMRLLSYQSNGIEYVHIVTCLGEFKCESCLAQKYAELSVEHALEAMPVPNVSCTSPVGYCRCHYFPAYIRLKRDAVE